MTDEQITLYASYGGLVVQNPRANIDLSWQIKMAAELERQRMEEEAILAMYGYEKVQRPGQDPVYKYRPDWFVILAPTLIPLVPFLLYFGLMFLKIWLISRGP